MTVDKKPYVYQIPLGLLFIKQPMGKGHLWRTSWFKGEQKSKPKTTRTRLLKGPNAFGLDLNSIFVASEISHRIWASWSYDGHMDARILKPWKHIVPKPSASDMISLFRWNLHSRNSQEIFVCTKRGTVRPPALRTNQHPFQFEYPLVNIQKAIENVDL